MCQDRDPAWRRERPLAAWGPQRMPGTQDCELPGARGVLRAVGGWMALVRCGAVVVQSHVHLSVLMSLMWV